LTHSEIVSFLRGVAEGDFYVRSGPGRVRLAPNSAREYISTRFSLGG
jgi:hypothetical protein